VGGEASDLESQRILLQSKGLVGGWAVCSYHCSIWKKSSADRVTRSAGSRSAIRQCRSEQVVGGAVKVVPAPVIASRRARIGVTEGILHILQRRA